MAENQQLILDGDVSPLRQKLREATRDLKQFGAEGSASVEKIGGPLKALQEKFIAVGAILAGGAVFKEAVAQTAVWAQESVDLADALGMTADAASNLKAALAAEGVEVGQFVAAGQKLANTLRTNEQSLNEVGQATRDAAGNLRPLNDLTVDAIELVGQYKAGTDRAVAASILFGKGFEINGDLAKVNSQIIAEYTEKQRALGMVMTDENVAAFEAYDQAGKDTDLTLRGIGQTIGNAVMPVLTKLSEWFVSIGPAAITIIKGALGSLIAAFWALKNGVVVVWETLNAMVVTVVEPLRALASALAKVATGDFKGAWAEFGKAGQTMATAWKGALGEMAKSSQETRDKIWNLFATGAPSAGPSKDGKSAGGLLKDGAGGKSAGSGKQASESDWAAEVLAWETRTAQQLQKIRIEHEEAANAAILAADKKLLAEIEGVHALRLDGARAADLARVGDLEAAANHERELGRITQEEYLARMQEFNAQRLGIEQAYLNAKREILLADPDNNPVELERLQQEQLEIRRRYAAQGMEIQRQQAIESQSIWRSLGDTVSGLWDKGITAIMQGTFTWRNALQSVFAEIAGAFGAMIGKQAKAWIAEHVRMLAVKMGFAAQEKTIQAASAASTIDSKTAETTVVAGQNAVQAGTGAAASQASIPFAGPILALAAMATIFAAVSAMGKRKSAMGGYDIPRGLNPMVQTHEEEMILPKQYANVIRNLAGGQDGEGTNQSQGVRIINVIDPALSANYLNSAAGERVILNHIRNNAGAVRQVLA